MSKHRLCPRHRGLYTHIKAQHPHWPRPERQRWKADTWMQCRACQRLTPAVLPWMPHDPEEA